VLFALLPYSSLSFLLLLFLPVLTFLPASLGPGVEQSPPASIHLPIAELLQIAGRVLLSVSALLSLAAEHTLHLQPPVVIA